MAFRAWRDLLFPGRWRGELGGMRPVRASKVFVGSSGRLPEKNITWRMMCIAPEQASRRISTRHARVRAPRGSVYFCDCGFHIELAQRHRVVHRRDQRRLSRVHQSIHFDPELADDRHRRDLWCSLFVLNNGAEIERGLNANFAIELNYPAIDVYSDFGIVELSGNQWRDARADSRLKRSGGIRHFLAHAKNAPFVPLDHDYVSAASLRCGVAAVMDVEFDLVDAGIGSLLLTDCG